MRPLWVGALGGLAASPVVVGLLTVLRYIWPGFPLLRVLDLIAAFVVQPIAVLTGQPVVRDALGGIESGMVTLLLGYTVVLVLWSTVCGLVGGAVWEQARTERGDR